MRCSKNAVAIFGLLGVLACSGQTRGSNLPRPAALENDSKEAEEDREPAPPENVVIDAARPFGGYRPIDNETFDEEQLITFLASADAICVGERHDQVIDHFAELRLLEGFAERRALRGFELGLALEMVRSRDQPTLKAYQEGKITDEEFEGLARFSDEWGYPIQYYRPQMSFAANNRVHLLALGVDRDFTREVSRVGFHGLGESSAAALPEVDSKNTEHRALFDGLMEGHPMEGGTQNYYDAQLVWDESMAETSAAWLSERAPGRKLVIMAGLAHCHRTAIPARIFRRTGARVVSIMPVDDGTPKELPSHVQTTQDRLVSGYDYQMVFSR